MAKIVFYQAEAWHQFKTLKDRRLSQTPALVIIPEGEAKGQVAAALPEVTVTAIRTITELLAGYVKKRQGKGLLSRHGVESILSAIMSESYATYLNIERYKQSYVKVLAEFIHGFRSTSTADLQAAITGLKTDRLSLKEKDLIKIHRAYEEKLPGYGFDLRSGLEEFTHRAGAGDLEGLPGFGEGEQVLFFGFNYITPLEQEFILAVFKNALASSFCCCDDTAAAEQARRVHRSIAALPAHLRDEAAPYEFKKLPSPEDDLFTGLARSLFKPGQAAAPETETDFKADPAKRHGSVTVNEANSRYLEVIAIARRVRELAETGVPLSDIRITAPAYHLYCAIIGEVFPDYGIPFTPAEGVPLTRFPLAALILHLVNQTVSPNPYPLREKIFSSPYVSLTATVKPAELFTFQEKSGVMLLSLEKLRQQTAPDACCRLDYQFLKNLRLKAYRSVAPVPGTPPLEVLKRYIESLAWKNDAAKEKMLYRCLAQAYLQALAEKHLSTWRQRRLSGNEFAEVLRRLLERFNILQNIATGAGDNPDPRAARIRERDAAILKRVDQILAEIAASPAAAGGPAAGKQTLVELARVFTRLMNESALDTGELPFRQVSESVTVESAARGQYRRRPYTFICGLVDGEFPAKEEFNFLQPKKEGLSPGVAYTSVDHGRNRFYQLVRSTSRALFLSRPLSDQGKRLPASPFLKETAGWTGARARPPENSRPAADDRIYSRREMLTLIASNVDHNYRKALPCLKELRLQDKPFFEKITAILRFDGLTLSTRSFSEYDGLFPRALASTTASLLAEDIRQIAFTPMNLERYATCPIRFFFDDLLGLKRAPDYHPDTTETGLLIRNILKSYTAAACANRGVPEAAPQLLQSLVDERLQEKEETGADAFRHRFIGGLTAGLDGRSERRPGLLRAFLDYEANGPDYLRPYWACLKGTVTLDNELEILVETDRVDLTAAGDYLLAYNYTSTTAQAPRKIERGLRFDLPLAVLLCADHAAGQQLQLPVAGAGLYLVKSAKTLRRGGYFALEEIRASRRDQASPEQPVFSGQRDGFLDRAKFNAALEKIKEHLPRLHRLMKAGVFHLPLCHEAEQDCDNCSFSRVCRKDQPRLEKLKQVYGRDAAAGEKVNLVSEIF
ncbi:MAG: PD-(D/E)XK nuclease family protein [Bacillota bacterium]